MAQRHSPANGRFISSGGGSGGKSVAAPKSIGRATGTKAVSGGSTAKAASIPSKATYAKAASLPTPAAKRAFWDAHYGKSGSPGQAQATAPKTTTTPKPPAKGGTRQGTSGYVWRHGALHYDGKD